MSGRLFEGTFIGGGLNRRLRLGLDVVLLHLLVEQRVGVFLGHQFVPLLLLSSQSFFLQAQSFPS